MAALSDQTIADYAVQAGFTGQALINIIAIVLAESGGDPNAHCQGCSPQAPLEDSRGLAQINVGPGGNTQYSSWNLYDPLSNLSAAWSVSSGGTNFNPWTTFTGGKYLQYLPRAEAAAAQVSPLATSLGSTTSPVATTAQGAASTVSGLASGLSTAASDAAKGVSSIPTAIGQLSTTIAAAIDSAHNLAAFFQMPHLWIRLAMIVGGALLIVLGLVMFALSFIKPSAVPVVGGLTH